MTIGADFRSRLLKRECLLGTFIKTPSAQHVEIAGLAGLDFVVMDAEHAVFSPDALDHCLLGCRAARIAGLVRVPNSLPSTILQVLDMGADGIVVPHISTAEQARAVVGNSRYRGGHRGYSNSPRAGEYGNLSMDQHVKLNDASVSVICQVEDNEAVKNIESIAAVDGIDCLFIGRADLAVSCQAFDLNDARVEQAVDTIVRAVKKIPLGTFCSDASPVRSYASKNISFFILGSDQMMLRAGLAQLKQDFRNFTASPT